MRMKKKVFREKSNNIREEVIKEEKKSTKRGKKNDKPNK